MKKFSLVCALALCVITLSGCTSVVHERSQVGPDGKVIAIETESAHAFLSKESIQKLHISTREAKDGTYTHTLSAAGVTSAGDTEMAKTLIESTGGAVGEGIRAAAGIPSLPKAP